MLLKHVNHLATNKLRSCTIGVAEQVCFLIARCMLQSGFVVSGDCFLHDFLLVFIIAGRPEIKKIDRLGQTSRHCENHFPRGLQNSLGTVAGKIEFKPAMLRPSLD